MPCMNNKKAPLYFARQLGGLFFLYCIYYVQVAESLYIPTIIPFFPQLVIDELTIFVFFSFGNLSKKWVDEIQKL